MNPFYSNIKKTIYEHGFMVMAVGAGENGEHPFFYTIGLTELNMPEILIVGDMHPHIAHLLLSRAVEIFKEKGEIKGFATTSLKAKPVRRCLRSFKS
ncbi:hypothetical protein JCM19235_1345 [Vibrio maritimus]|uniref:Uncharacterized protein n=1 Tax=Vibrio maritimus TaxID=990268 RepID=A0A090S972_9VIBR|nr:hypothetical protein JCM19235_1345 [Vibrio maritimus]